MTITKTQIQNIEKEAQKVNLFVAPIITEIPEGKVFENDNYLVTISTNEDFFEKILGIKPNTSDEKGYTLVNESQYSRKIARYGMKFSEHTTRISEFKFLVVKAKKEGLLNPLGESPESSKLMWIFGILWNVRLFDNSSGYMQAGKFQMFSSMVKYKDLDEQSRDIIVEDELEISKYFKVLYSNYPKHEKSYINYSNLLDNKLSFSHRASLGITQIEKYLLAGDNPTHLGFKLELYLNFLLYPNEALVNFKIDDLYKKRSAFYHSYKENFSETDYRAVRGLLREVILHITQRSDFDNKKLKSKVLDIVRKSKNTAT